VRSQRHQRRHDEGHHHHDACVLHHGGAAAPHPRGRPHRTPPSTGPS
jgi:hypothetical protein